MWHRLSLALGCTVKELQEKMTLGEFRSWLAYNHLEPIGNKGIIDTIALGSASMVALFAEKNADINVEDFIPDYKGEETIAADRVNKMKATMATWGQRAGATKVEA